MGWLEKRQDPIKDVPAETKESQLPFVDWLGVDWLNETTKDFVNQSSFYSESLFRKRSQTSTKRLFFLRYPRSVLE
jgi:hypothetical protein